MNFEKPTVFKGHLFGWKTFQKWSLEYLMERFRYDVSFTIGKIADNTTSIRDEVEQTKIELSFKEFNSWCNGNTVPKLLEFDKKTYYAYFSYQYVNEIFNNDNHLIDDIDWTYFGLDKNLKQSTVFWLGSGGAYTNCHYDTYSMNIVCQLRGKKKWILFPPYDTKYLYPTRIPYEESSVFSCIDFRSVDPIKYKLVNQTNPHVVILEAGDMLIVPRHWWHFVRVVESDDGLDDSNYSLSVNLWLDDNESDQESRISEALVKMNVFSFVDSTFFSDVETPVCLLSNPDEIMNNKWGDETLRMLSYLLNEKKERKTHRFTLIGLEDGNEVLSVPPCELFMCKSETKSFESLTKNDILDVFNHPEVIELVKHLLYEKVGINNDSNK